MIYYDLKTETKRKTIGNVIARDTELRRIARTLKRQYNNNCLITGASGTGKTALLEGFAYQISKETITGFEKTTLSKLDSSNIKKYLNGANISEAVAFLNGAFKSLPSDTIVFIDDFENIIPESKSFELNQIFEAFLERNDLRLCITINENKYQKLLEQNTAFFQNFEEISLKESDSKETLQILESLCPAFEKEYQINIQKEALKSVVELSRKVVSEKKSPLHAIHMLDEALAFAKITGASKELNKQDVAEVFAEKTGIPSASLNSDDSKLLKNLETELEKGIIGQENAIKIVSDIVRRG
ncbi:MAG: ATP-dependent Clp protease ATP-binding subunit ClpC, partial [Candidatus Doudnabacteria bacterium Gr01-1014_77]